MRTRGGGRQAHRVQLAHEAPPQRSELLDGSADVSVDAGRELDHTHMRFG
jgi:hypothetical protein